MWSILYSEQFQMIVTSRNKECSIFGTAFHIWSLNLFRIEECATCKPHLS